MKVIYIILSLIVFSCISYSQMGEALGSEVMRQELEEANETDVYEPKDTNQGPRYDEKIEPKVDEEYIESQPEGPVNEVLEEEATFSEEKYESSAWVYVILVIIGLLAIFAFYRFKIGKSK